MSEDRRLTIDAQVQITPFQPDRGAKQPVNFPFLLLPIDLGFHFVVLHESEDRG